MLRELVDVITKVTPLKLFLDVVPSSCADNVSMRVAWMKMRVKATMLST